MIRSGEIGSIVSPKLNQQAPVLREHGQSVQVLLPKDRLYNRFSTYHLVGEEAGIKRIDIKDKDDVSKMWEIERSEGMLKWINEAPDDACKNKQELKDWIEGKSYDDKNPKKRHKKSNTKLYAITKNDAGNIIPDSHSSRSQAIEGWVRVDGSSADVGENLERRRYERIMKTTLPESRDYPSPIELSYIKRPGGPPHLMPSAIRQICHMIITQDGEVNRNFFYEQADKIVSKRIVMAFVDPKNPSGTFSERALIEAGFERVVRDDIRWEEDDPKSEQRHMFVLNWEKFQEIRDKLEKSSESNILKKLQSRIITSTPDHENTKKYELKRVRDILQHKGIRKTEFLTKTELGKAVDIYSAFQDLAQTHPDDFVVTVSTPTGNEKLIGGELQFMSLEASAIVEGNQYNLTYWFEPIPSDIEHGIQERIEIHKPHPAPDMEFPLNSLSNNPECELIYAPIRHKTKDDPRSLGTTTSIPGNDNLIEILKEVKEPQMAIDDVLSILAKLKEEPTFLSLDTGSLTEANISITYKQFLSLRDKDKLPPLTTLNY